MSSQGKKKDFKAIADGYIDDVLSGRILACTWVKKACERQRRDLARQHSKAWPYRFDDNAAARVCRFIELLPHVKGEWAARGELISLEPWQVFILTTVFGWLKKDDGSRRFRTVYTEVPRKNAKSALTSGVGLYMLAADGEAGAEVYSAASKRDQARVVYDTSKAMVDKLPAMRSKLGVQTNSLAICIPSKLASFKALAKAKAGGGSNHDGLNIHCGIVDELHAHPDGSMWDVLSSGVGARRQPLIWAITTAGYNRAGICYEQRSYACKVLDRVADDESFFGIIYTIDKGDDWKDPESWIKANPNWGVSVMPDSVQNACTKAITLASARPEFMTKHLNVWCNSDSNFMDMTHWEKCADDSLREEDFSADECMIGADLAAKNDFASFARVYKRDIKGVAHYYAFCTHYNNSKAIEENPNPGLKRWKEDGWITEFPGRANDFSVIQDDIEKSATDGRVVEVAFDPHNAWQMSVNLKNAGIEVVEFSMNVSNMSEPTKELQALVESGRFHHNGDPVLAWMVSNVVGHLDNRDRIYPKRERSMPHQKIDGAIAVIIALGRWIVKTDDEYSYDIIVL